MLGCFVVTVMIEYPVIYALLGRRLKAPIQLFLWVLLVNVITFPGVMCALGALPFLGYEQFVWLWLGLIECAVVVVEFVILKLVFNRMCRTHALDEPILAKRTFVIALVANLASFVFGAIADKVIIIAILGG